MEPSLQEFLKVTREAIESLNMRVDKEVKALKGDIGDIVGEGGAERKEKLNKMVQDLSDLRDEVVAKEAEYKKRMDTLEETFQAAGSGEGDDAPHESAGRKFFKAMLKSSGITAEELTQDSDQVSKLALQKWSQRHNTDIRRDLAPKRFKVLTSQATSAGDLQIPEYETAILAPGEEMVTLLDMLPMSTTMYSRCFWRTEVLASRTNGAGIQSLDFTGAGQGTALGKSDFVFDNHSTDMRTFGHTTDMALQILQDQSQVESYIAGRMMYQARWNLEDQVVYGDGTGYNFDSINGGSTVYDASADDDIGVSRTHKIDVLRLAKLQGDNTYIPTTGYYMNRNDAAAIQVLKDNDGRYLFTNNVNMPNEMRPWGVPVIQTNHILKGTFFALPLNQIEVVVRKQWETGMFYENKDNVEKLLVTFRIYGRYGLKLYYPASMIKGSFEV